MRKYLKDSRGNESSVLTIVMATWVVMTVAFFMDKVAPAEYISSIGVMLTGWLYREWVEKTREE